ncbi:DUF983 domain-containing protein [Pontibacter liquoris]|uniref:DUF983 domain-containing protein n=1 Tax=Pontibacter liquoris TaxID=2905677 RepID=UPI001FA6B6F7|nr:DUF983 domain-containing protein [Pontibacter liquoris]
MSWKETKLYSIVNMKCPRCHEGDLFPKGTLFKVQKFADMYETCPCCGLHYEPEPGYYYGAMFVSYGLTTAVVIGLWLLLDMLMDEVTMTAFIISLIVVLLLLTPLLFRLSRAIWINFFVSYKGVPKS